MMTFLESSLLPVVLTLGAFYAGQACQKKWKLPLFNPILIAAVLVIAFLLLTGMELDAYTAGNARLSWLMTPATIALAIPMYEQVQVLRKNLKAIVIGVAAGAVSCMAVLLAGAVAMGLGRTLTVSLLPKSVTTAIAVPLSQLQGGLTGVTVAAISVTGIFTNMAGVYLCKLFHITDETAQGVAFGTAGHVIGTARAGELSRLAGAVSSLSLVVAGLLTAVLLPVFAGLL